MLLLSISVLDFAYRAQMRRTTHPTYSGAGNRELGRLEIHVLMPHKTPFRGAAAFHAAMVASISLYSS